MRPLVRTAFALAAASVALSACSDRPVSDPVVPRLDGDAFNRQQELEPGIHVHWALPDMLTRGRLVTVGGKDWYGWAAHMLVTNQHPDGSWASHGHFHGQSPTINTCLALLTLKRANFVPDLTESLQEYIPIRDPGGKQ